MTTPGVNVKLLCTGLIAALVLTSAPLCADGLSKPRKVTTDEASGPIFSSPNAVHDNRSGPITNVQLMSSNDKKFTAGLFKAGAADIPFDSYPDDEFCYFLSGSVQLTSADGSIVELKAGEAVVIPKGWKGRWTTAGYSKYYVVYDTK
jgi:ethanolamine utilization protein EutQ